MKKVISLLLVVAMIVSMAPMAMATNGWTDSLFEDVLEENWFYETVKTAYELGLMSGYGDGSFNPKGEISFAETIAVAARIHAIHSGETEEFKQGKPWYQVYVDYAAENGIIEKTDYSWGDAATRLEFAEILSRSLPADALKAINTVEDGAIPDVKDNAAVYLLYRAGILKGNDAKGSFLPKDNIARCEVAAIASRMLVEELRESITLKNDEASEETTPGSTIVVPETKPEETPETAPEDYIDETNALAAPFDLVYPDLFASGEIVYSGEQIVIKLADKPSGEEQRALSNAGVERLELLMEIGENKWYKAFVNGDVTAVMEKVRELAFVLMAEYDFAYETDTIIECEPGDLLDIIKDNLRYDEQWHLRSCGVDKSWRHIREPHKRPGYEGAGEAENVSNDGAEGIVVAVIDTGVDYTHTDLVDNIWVNKGEIPDDGIDNDGNGYIDDYYGYNAVADKGSGMDDQGHGTHVAGIIAASNNNAGVVGIAYNAKIMPIKAGMASGYFNNSDIAEAIIYAADNGADVINMSFGGSATTTFVQEALAYAYTNCVLVAAAGNDGAKNEGPFSIPTYPAALSYVLGVMSVNENGVESSFTNWDVTAFNSVEYEVYAPGESILSTIPGNRYAKWDGTSMAAPIVSAAAALLRAEYRDNSIYPTKFIYGQICGTTQQNATCYNPDDHGRHNLPGILDIYSALTELPTPDVDVQDYTVFDTVGLMGNENNNGDGVIDAGETIAIGFTLRNKWGKSTNTVVSVDTLSSQAGIADPYITIHNGGSVNYGEVGTYSTQDAGKVMTGDVWTGWENPIYITVSPNCPNDYIFKLNVIVTCENALDTNDLTSYRSDTSVNLSVKRGVILPNRIKQDMVLTADQYYIIPDDTLIMEGVTVTVEAGTKIQFWSDDPENAYAENAVAALTVRGTFICNGTADEPIEIFPSELMSEYAVVINNFEGGGNIELHHTNVVNPYFESLYYEGFIAENCEFTTNYTDENIRLRMIYEGDVITNAVWPIIICVAKNCAFYGLQGIGCNSDGLNCGFDGRFDGCIFADCGGFLRGDYTNCVFYGNNTKWANENLWAELELEYDGTSAFKNNAIINRLIDTDVTKWFRVHSAQGDGTLSLSDNYWGTTNELLIDYQIVDFDDFVGLADIDETPYLTVPPENVWPFVVNAGLIDSSGNQVDTIGNETVTFYVEFNRDMDTSIPLDVRFGSYYPYTDYEVDGEYVSARRWEGTTTLTTLIEAGYQFWSIDNARAADNKALTLCKDWGRFTFEIDTSSALAMILQAEATDTSINLSWTQDDFSTLAGYNIYRADKDEDGYYQKLNSSIIPVGEEEWIDDTVEPGQIYYYIFTVVKTDLTESEPSGKKMIMSKDTMTPVMYHTPVYQAYEGSNVVISATVTDNVALQSVKLHYSVAGGQWKSVEMTNLNDKYSAVISGDNVTLDGIKYYISAFDGVGYSYKGSESDPYVIVVQANPGEQMNGDVNGDGSITISDALMVLRAANNKVVLDAEQFARADLNGDSRLSAAEALVILKYANGEIGSLTME